jgi:hypothetical protein
MKVWTKDDYNIARPQRGLHTGPLNRWYVCAMVALPLIAALVLR